MAEVTEARIDNTEYQRSPDFYKNIGIASYIEYIELIGDLNQGLSFNVPHNDPILQPRLFPSDETVSRGIVDGIKAAKVTNTAFGETVGIKYHGHYSVSVPVEPDSKETRLTYHTLISSTNSSGEFIIHTTPLSSVEKDLPMQILFDRHRDYLESVGVITADILGEYFYDRTKLADVRGNPAFGIDQLPLLPYPLEDARTLIKWIKYAVTSAPRDASPLSPQILGMKDNQVIVVLSPNDTNRGQVDGSDFSRIAILQQRMLDITFKSTRPLTVEEIEVATSKGITAPQSMVEENIFPPTLQVAFIAQAGSAFSVGISDIVNLPTFPAKLQRSAIFGQQVMVFRNKAINEALHKFKLLNYRFRLAATVGEAVLSIINRVN